MTKFSHFIKTAYTQRQYEIEKINILNIFLALGRVSAYNNICCQNTSRISLKKISNSKKLHLKHKVKYIRTFRDQLQIINKKIDF